MALVLSGTGRVVRSGTADSSYREPERLVTRGNKTANPAPSNHANREESFGFLLTRRAVVEHARISPHALPEAAVTMLVGDCFAGAGVVGEAARATGRHYLGREIDPEMATRTNARIAATLPFDRVKTAADHQSGSLL